MREAFGLPFAAAGNDSAGLQIMTAVVVPQRAVQELQGTYNVAVVNADSTIEIRPVKVTHRVGDEWVVGSGLTAGERIVVEGLQKVRQGAKVRPMEAGAAAGDSAGAR